jgi:hypothetical protein
VARKLTGAIATYRTPPTHPWAEDSSDFFLFGSHDPGGHGSNDFRSLKANIFYASCVLSGSELRLRAESDGAAAVRAQVGADGKVTFSIDNLWGYPDLAWGNLAAPLHLPKTYSNSVQMRFADNDDVAMSFEDAALPAAQ